MRSSRGASGSGVSARCRSPSSTRRAGDESSSSAEYTETPVRWCLAAYMATSAVRISDDGSVAWSGRQATPTDVSTCSGSSPSMNGGTNSPRTRRARRSALTTEAGDDVVVPQRAAQPLRDLLQQLVAAVVAERVVDVLEPVDVEQHEPD